MVFRKMVYFRSVAENTKHKCGACCVTESKEEKVRKRGGMERERKWERDRERKKKRKHILMQVCQKKEQGEEPTERFSNG